MFCHISDYWFGSGNNMLHLLNKGFDVSGVEISEQAIQLSQKRVDQVDLRLISDGMIPVEDGSFDAVIAWQVVYYNDWNTLSVAVAEIDRVLRSGELFIYYGNLW